MSASRSCIRRSKAGITKLEVVALLFIVTVLMALLLPAVQQERGSRRNPCKNNLKQIGLTLHNYHDTYGSLPPAVTYGPDGKPWHSWRTPLLPYLEEQDLYERYRFDEPWNGPHNSRLANEAGSLPFFHCYADENAATGETSYVAVTGDGTLWPRDGVGHIDTDERSRSILVAEVSDSGVHWMEPRDLPFDKMTFEIGAKKGVGIRSRHGGTERWFREDDPTFAHVLLGDGVAQTLGGPDLKPGTVRSMLLCDDGGPEEE